MWPNENIQNFKKKLTNFKKIYSPNSYLKSHAVQVARICSRCDKQTGLCMWCCTIRGFAYFMLAWVVFASEWTIRVQTTFKYLVRVWPMTQLFLWNTTYVFLKELLNLSAIWFCNYCITKLIFLTVLHSNDKQGLRNLSNMTSRKFGIFRDPLSPQTHLYSCHQKANPPSLGGGGVCWKELSLRWLLPTL